MTTTRRTTKEEKKTHISTVHKYAQTHHTHKTHKQTECMSYVCLPIRNLTAHILIIIIIIIMQRTPRAIVVAVAVVVCRAIGRLEEDAGSCTTGLVSSIEIYLVTNISF